ncbi:hypothetical protein BKP45_02880 [Anaerobacillus alkalidiazotrophicus]|uniref:Haloacid dehalogenase n=1 Tax=Anaerobacillus alkalidiazotrophicus TaxID=472963 RepID=A0A1S2MA83_9BACI|nr:HAD hydrolase family protein [Anaerobacillus alkalidiazotrophicus]OIJ21682.1 hypothetical protein BKP45_02880 [Anaerobacillus alkalidiazotrophicus]
MSSSLQKKPVILDEEKFHRLTADEPCNVIIHTEEGIYCKERSRDVNQWIQEGRKQPKYVGDLRHANYGDVLKYSVITGKANHSLSMLFTNEAELINWENGFEIVACGVSKWSAIKTLIRAYGIRKDEIVTIGDGPNDISMLNHAGMGVAMGNAASNVKAAANLVIGDHEEDALAKFIEVYLIHSYFSMELA